MSIIHDQYKMLLEAFNALREEIFAEEYHGTRPSEWRVQQRSFLVSKIAMNIATIAGESLAPKGERRESPHTTVI